MKSGNGPLAGVKVLEFAGMGPGPFAAMMLSDMGADVLRIERKGAADPQPHNLSSRGRRIIEMDLKDSAAVEECLRLAQSADILIEGYRPGVMERRGLGPDAVLSRNPKIVYGRMTGWGQEGPLAQRAGHDINYLSLTGALHAIGTEAEPVPPLNLAADYGGGAMMLVAGVLAALLHARQTGRGQVVDAAMTDGAAYLMTAFYGMFAGGEWEDRRQANWLDGGAHYYGVYRCADGKWISVGSIEPQFYALLMEKTGAGEFLLHSQNDRGAWPGMRAKLETIFAAKTSEEWCEILGDTDVCFAPVLPLSEAPHHPHNVARQTFVELGGIVQPAPAPRFSHTPSAIRWAPAPVERDAERVMAEWIAPPS